MKQYTKKEVETALKSVENYAIETNQLEKFELTINKLKDELKKYS